MKRWLILLLAGVLGLTSLMTGCMAISAEEHCACMRDRNKFAEIVAQKVVEKQKQAECDKQN